MKRFNIHSNKNNSRSHLNRKILWPSTSADKSIINSTADVLLLKSLHFACPNCVEIDGSFGRCWLGKVSVMEISRLALSSSSLSVSSKNKGKFTVITDGQINAIARRITTRRNFRKSLNRRFAKRFGIRSILVRLARGKTSSSRVRKSSSSRGATTPPWILHEPHGFAY